jgi:pyruvate dehydrogenase E1 component alpha subunit
MRSHKDPITGLKVRLIDAGIATESELKEVDKAARKYVDEQVAEAEASLPPKAEPKILFEDVYVPGTEIPVLRGRIPEENWSFK